MCVEGCSWFSSSLHASWHVAICCGNILVQLAINTHPLLCHAWLINVALFSNSRHVLIFIIIVNAFRTNSFLSLAARQLYSAHYNLITQKITGPHIRKIWLFITLVVATNSNKVACMGEKMTHEVENSLGNWRNDHFVTHTVEVHKSER